MFTFHRTSSLPRLIATLSVVLLAALLSTTQASAQADPPGRVARLSYANGSLSFAPAGSGQWVAADLNRPLTTGDRLSVPAAARAELHIGAAVVRLNDNTGLSFLTLSDETVQLKLTRGTMLVRLRSLTGKEVFEIDTPNLAFSLQEPGEYRIDVNNDNTSSVTVRRGTGIAYGDRDSVTIREAEQARFADTNLTELSIGRMPAYDSFDRWANDRDRAEDRSVSAQYVSREVIGYQQLDEYGTWETDAEYGAIWLPRQTEIGWAPYRNGSWLWVAPWGWTWIDRAPWGFAPYHYGRWAHIGPRWAWVPGPHIHHDKPIYAPALVAFIGGGEHGYNLSLNNNAGHIAGRAHAPAVAWFPLGPGEAYHPGYAASPTYLNRLNRDQSMTNEQQPQRPAYVNQHIRNAVTAVPAANFANGHFVGAIATPLSPQQIRNAQIGTAAPALAPSRESLYGGAAKRVATPENSQLMQRPVITTIRPAELPARQHGATEEKFIPSQGGRPNRVDNNAERYPAETRARTGVSTPAMPAMPALSTPPATPATPSGLLHNAIRPENPVRNLRSEGGKVPELPAASDNRSRYPLRSSPPENAEPARRQAPPARHEIEPNQPQFERPRSLPANPARIEERRDAPASHGLNNIQQENATSPVHSRGAERSGDRSAERPSVAPREMPRSIVPAVSATPQAPRAERQPNIELRREVPPNPAKPENEKEHKEKTELRNNARTRPE